MQFFRNLSVRAKLFGGFGVVLALTTVMGVVMILQIGSVNAGGQYVGTNSLPSVSQTKQISIDITDYRRAQLGALLDQTAATTNADLATAQADANHVATDLKGYGSSISNATDRELWNTVKQQWATYLAASADLKTLALAVHASLAAQAQAKQRTFPAFTAMQRTINTWANDNVTWGEAKVKGNASTYSTAKTIGIAILVIALGLGLGIAYLIATQIRRSVMAILERLRIIKEKGAQRIREALELLADGDLTDEIHPVTEELSGFPEDELGDVQRLVEETRGEMVRSIEAYNTAREQLGEMIGEVSETAATVSSSSHQMASTSEEAGRATGEIANAVGGIAHGAERQVQAVQQARATAGEVGRAVSEAAENAARTAEVAQDAREAAQQGVSAAEEANEAMHSVRDSSAAVTGVIRELATKSEQIGAIVATITGLAEQTNLLALNAAIEAARAGEQGRGFAVVAEEVRKLAEESSSAAHEIATLIGSIQSETSHAVGVVEEGAAQTKQGATVVEQTREAFLRIGTSVDDMTARIEQIAAVSQQIAASAQSMQDSINEVAAVAEESSASTEEVSASTEETSASTEQIAASAQELSGNAETLNRLVSRFRLTS